MSFDVIIESADDIARNKAVEIVERKGVGHPDSLCDGIAERISIEYCRWCQSHLGQLMHHNFDKLQLVAGQVNVEFGGGRLLKPIRIQVAGRASHEGPDRQDIPVADIVTATAKQHILETMQHLDPDLCCRVECYVGDGSPELIQATLRQTANDTSFGVDHWPLSPLEELVKTTANHLNGSAKRDFPIGEDIKVMAVRRGEDVAMTCAVPFLSRQVSGLEHYLDLKQRLHSQLLAMIETDWNKPCDLVLNAADDVTTAQVYLTLTGTSGECGDDGAVGRGNRIGGVINPFYPASLEAACGKNPFSHPGKLYNVIALLACQDIVREINEVSTAQVFLLSRIGRPLSEPQIVYITVATESGRLSRSAEKRVTELIKVRLTDISQVTAQLIAGELSLY